MDEVSAEDFGDVPCMHCGGKGIVPRVALSERQIALRNMRHVEKLTYREMAIRSGMTPERCRQIIMKTERMIAFAIRQRDRSVQGGV